jgi:hypothetical protein
MQTDTRRYLTAIVLLLAGAAYANLLWARRAPEVHFDVSFRDLPRQVGDMTGAPVPVEKRIFDYLGADAMDELEYTTGQRSVRVSLVYGRDWRAVHSPLSCLPQQGYQVQRKQMVDLPAPLGTPHPGPLHGQQILGRRGTDGLLVLYVFAHEGGTTGDWVKQGWAVSETPRGSGGLMISLSTPVVGGDVAAAEKVLRQLLSAIYVPAVSFWYH